MTFRLYPGAVITVETSRQIPEILRLLAEYWEMGRISVASLPAILEPPVPASSNVDVAVVIVPKSHVTKIKQSQELLAKLTVREKEVLTFVVDGKKAKLIAHEMGISQRTVENHVSSILRKTMSPRMTHLFKIAFATFYL